MFLTEPDYWLKNELQKNFGDFLSEYFLRHLFLPVSMHCEGLRVVGSCISNEFIEAALKEKNDKVVFWGCGLREEFGITRAAREASKFLAVRGPLTKGLLELGDDIPIGDPGLLMPALYKPQIRKELLGVSLLVPHFWDQRDAMTLKKISGCEVVLRPNLANDLNEISRFIDCVYSAEFVLAGSLHAAIVAAAYGKPFGFWESGSVDLPFKWRDFSASLSIPCAFHEALTDAKNFYAEAISDRIKMPILWPLLVSAPMPVRSEVLVNTIDLDLQRHGDGIFKICRPQPTSPLIVESLLNTVESVRQKQTEYIERINEISELFAVSDDKIRALNSVLNEQNKLNESLAQEITGLKEEIMRRSDWAFSLDAELKEEREKSYALLTSRSWRITLPLRELKRWVTSPLDQTKRYAKRIIRGAKGVYATLPLSLQTKAKHRQWLEKFAPRLIRAINASPGSIAVRDFPRRLVSCTTVQIDLQSIKSMNSDSYIMVSTSDNPIVSVIVPVHGKLDYTLRCLASIAAHPPLVEFEVIIVDDFSPDETWTVLSRKVKGVRVLRNDNNEGFIRSCNIGAREANGRYLYFLNNDTQVTEGWLDALLYTFNDFPGTGLAGSKLVYPDGRLQEAGGIVWQNGTAWNFGRLEDPSLPIFNYAREVDYCSGASIMVPKFLFDELGGFDEHYLPAYCEDSDLALKIRDKGYRVIYQPLSTVIHYEGITSGTDVTQGTKSYQFKNSKKLFERWQQRLQYHQKPGDDLDNAKDRRSTRRVLVLDHCTPTPNQDAGSVTAFNLLLLLREMDFQVTFIPEDNFLYMPDETSALQRSGIEVLYSPYVQSVDQHLAEAGSRYDLVFLFRPLVVDRHLKSVRKYCPDAKVLYETADLHYLRMEREAELTNDAAKRKAAAEMKSLELSALCKVDAAIIRSGVEIELLQTVVPVASLHLFPLIMNIQGTSRKFSDRKDIVFVGGYRHTPNVDAVKYFVREVMPILRMQIPGVQFYVVGSNPPSEIQALASEDVIITGFVENLNSFLDNMRVSVAPLRYGAGIKGKIGTSMAVGLPVVATEVAVEGMLLTDSENVLVVDNPVAFADAIARVYCDEVLWSNLSHNGLVFADKMWGPEAAWRNLSTILEDLGFEVKPRVYPVSLYLDNSYILPSDALR